MTIQFAAAPREVLEQVVQDPRFRALTDIPLLAPMEIALIAGAWLLFGASSWSWLASVLPLPVVIALNGFAIYVAFTPLHDATHRTVSSNRALNDLLGTVSCLLLLPGITTGVYRYLHLEHHRYTGDRVRDPDEPFVSARSWRAIAVTAGLDVLWVRWYLQRWNSRPVGERVQFAVGIGFYLALHVAMLVSPWALEFALLWMIPQRIGLFLVSWFFARIQHPEDVLWEEAPFQTTVRVACSPLERALMLGQTVHCLHHLAPSVPWYRYQRAWDLGRERFETQGIPVRTLWTPAELPQPATEPRWLQARVSAAEDVAEDVRALTLEAADERGWPAFTAGAHVELELPNGQRRQYSLCSDPASCTYRIAVRLDRDGRGGSRCVHEGVAVGDLLRMSEPRNQFPLREDAGEAGRVLLVAGGIGVTPLLAMAWSLHHAGVSFELHLRARGAPSLPFGAELDGLPFRAAVRLWLDDAEQAFDPTTVLGPWRPGDQLYLCGPPGFMDLVREGADAGGWSEDAIRSERFVPARLDAADNRPFEVELARSGEVLEVPADRSLIDVLHEHGHYVMCSCTQGVCGSCRTPVLAGEPEHRDVVLTEAERAANDQMTVCVSRARSARLILDL